MLYKKLSAVLSCLALATFSGTGQDAHAELALAQQARAAKVAVLRMKYGGEDPRALKRPPNFAQMLSAILAESAQLDVLEWQLARSVTDSVGLQQDGLLDEAALLNAGKLLGATHIVAGSVMKRNYHARADVRILSVDSGTVVGTASAEYSATQPAVLLSMIASKVASILTQKSERHAQHGEFRWNQEFRLDFSSRNVDTRFPSLIYVNADPPFEITVATQIEKAPAGHRVTSFDIYVDNTPLATVYPDMYAPRAFPDQEVTIGDVRFRFDFELMELRTYAPQRPADRIQTDRIQSIKQALILIKTQSLARPRQEH